MRQVETGSRRQFRSIGHAGRLIAALLVTLLCLLPGLAEAGRRAVLVLRPELTVEAILGPGTPFAALLPRAAVGVMNSAVRGPRLPAAAYLTLGAGERLAAGPLAGPARFATERVEGDPVAAVYARRWGPLPRPVPALLHPGWAGFLNSFDPESTPSEQHAAGGLGQALRGRGGAAWLGVGEAARTRRGALTALDAAGTVRWAETATATCLECGRSPLSGGRHRSGILPSTRFAPGPGPPVGAPPARGNASIPLLGVRIAGLLRRAPLVVVDLPPSFTLSQLADLMAALAHDPELDLLLVSPYPLPGPGGAWDRLPPILGMGPDFPPGTLTSATTRTPGLVANLDVAPTLVQALGVASPETMRGRVMASVPPVDPLSIERFARLATLNQRAIVPLGIGVGAFAVVPLVLALLAAGSVRRERARSRCLAGSAAFTLRLAAASPLGLLLASVTVPGTVAGMGCAVALWSAGAAAVVSVIPGLRCHPLPGLYALTVACVAVDLLCGGTLVARSPLSGFAVAGIRFYGLGNEFLGVLAGMAILAPLLFEDRLEQYRWVQAAFFLALVLLIGSPQYGANLGGPPAAAAGFGATLMLAARPRRPWLALAVAGGAWVATSGAIFLVDAMRPPPLRSHIGDFAHAVWSGGWAAAAPVLRRKAAMNLRLLTSGFALVPIVAVAPLLALWYRGAGRRLQARLAARPELRAAAGGSLVAAWTALLGKDSGISPWMFITASLLALLLDEQLRAVQERSPVTDGQGLARDPG